MKHFNFKKTLSYRLKFRCEVISIKKVKILYNSHLPKREMCAQGLYLWLLKPLVSALFSAVFTLLLDS